MDRQYGWVPGGIIALDAGLVVWVYGILDCGSVELAAWSELGLSEMIHINLRHKRQLAGLDQAINMNRMCDWCIGVGRVLGCMSTACDLITHGFVWWVWFHRYGLGGANGHRERMSSLLAWIGARDWIGLWAGV